ncbi:MAG: ATP-binding cassette domain-containing protein [Rhizobiales bacterium]|nr:ATP-binding cassette domain-containing protein [Hyphomicrobiales bacterium]
MLELEDVRITLGAFEAKFSLEVASGEWLAVIGPSGAGKSTLLNVIGGFVRPEAGAILADGRNITALAPAARPVTTLFQDHNLFAHLSVADNVGLGIDPGLKLDGEAIARRDSALASVGLEGRGKDMPGRLSGGERQRVALARALVRDRPVLLLDEPLSQLDPALRGDMLELIGQLRQARALTIVMVLHTPEEAAEFVDRYAFIDEGAIAANISAADFAAGRRPEIMDRYLGRQG